MISRFLAPVFAAALLLAAPGCPAQPVTTTATVTPAGLPLPHERAGAIEINFVGDGGCSGYAVAPHIFVSAAHCFDPGTEIETINAMGRPPQPAEVLYTIEDKTDHVFVLTDYTFKHYAPAVRLDPVLPYQGEEIHYWGAPLGISDQYRQGYVTGYCLVTVCFPGLGEYMKWPAETQTALMSIDGQKGDSGAGVLNAAGELIGIVSLVQFQFPPPFVPMAIVEFSFTDEDIAMLDVLNDWRPGQPATGFSVGQ